MNIFFSVKLASGVSREENMCADTWWYSVGRDGAGNICMHATTTERGRQQQLPVVASAQKKREKGEGENKQLID
jgi:hypothetical protein